MSKVVYGADGEPIHEGFMRRLFFYVLDQNLRSGSRCMWRSNSASSSPGRKLRPHSTHSERVDFRIRDKGAALRCSSVFFYRPRDDLLDVLGELHQRGCESINADRANSSIVGNCFRTWAS
jgi:hypothetical protein